MNSKTPTNSHGLVTHVAALGVVLVALAIMVGFFAFVRKMLLQDDDCDDSLEEAAGARYENESG